MTQIVNLPTLTTSTTTNIVLPVADLNTNPGITKKITLDNLVTLARGLQGVQGVQGNQGLSGFTGSAGTGYTGSASTASGYTGSQGNQGIRGFSGSIGSTGTVGFTGSAGPSANQLLNTTSSVKFNSVTFTDGTTQTTALIKGVVTMNNLNLGDYDISSRTLQGNILVTPVNMGGNRKLNLPAPVLSAGSLLTIRNRDSINTLDLRWNGFNGTQIAVVAAGASILLACDNGSWFVDAAGSVGGSGNGYTGSKGDTGIQGAVGNTGYTGSQGSQGGAGAQGFVGFTGSVGSLGYTGSTGAGYTGSASAVIGYTGSTGSNGYTGSTGAGYTGSASTTPGYAGSVGFTGSAGAGFTGSAGSAGSTGYTGSAGSGGGTAYDQNLMTTSSVTFANLTVTNTLTAATLLIGQSGVGTVQSGNDLALKAAGNITTNAPFVLNVYTTSTLSAIAGPSIGSMVFLTNAPGGSQPVYYDGTHWYTVNARTQVL